MHIFTYKADIKMELEDLIVTWKLQKFTIYSK